MAPFVVKKGSKIRDCVSPSIPTPVSLIDSMTYSPANSGLMDARKVFVQRDVGGFDGELAALRHGVASVDRQVHDDLVDLARIGADAPTATAPGTMTRSMSSPIMRVSIFRFSVTTSFRSRTLGASICLRLKASNCRVSEVARRRGVGNLLRRPTQPRIGAQALEQKFGITGNHHQQIVEVVRDAAGEAADGFHFLRLTELHFQRSGLGHVFDENLERCRPTCPFGIDRPEMRATMEEPFRVTHSVVKIVEFLARMKIVGSLKPLLGIGVETSEMPARKLVGA